MGQNTEILAFNTGELSPKIDTRIDVEKYRFGCRRLENLIPTKYGAAVKRPGFAFIYDGTTAPNSRTTTTIRMLPFIYSASVVYQIEAGNYYFRFYYGGALLEDESSNEVYIETPYSEDDIFQIKYKQIGDVMWLVHPSYAPRKLKRTGPYTFVLEEIDFRHGPFLIRNDLLDLEEPNPTTLSCSVTTKGAIGALTASAAVFLPEHIDTLFKLSHARTIKSITLTGTGGTTNTSAIRGKGTYDIVTRGTWTGKIIWQRKEINGDWEELFSWKSSTDAYQNIIKAYTETDENVEHRLYSTDADTSLRADLSINEPLEAGIVKVIGVGDSYNAVVEVYSQLASTAATTRWYEGAWSKVRGYPSTVTFIEDRCTYAGAASGSAEDSTSAVQYPTLLNLTF